MPMTDKSEPKQRPGGIGPFWWGMIAGLGIVVAIFHKPVFGFLGEVAGGFLPMMFSPGFFEVSCAILGFTIVLVVLRILRREQRDEWVEMEVGDDSKPGDQ